MNQVRSSVILVFNDKDQLALQLRAATDYKYPSHWDFSAAGGIEDGEDPKTAAHRELQEEIGIEAKLEFVTETLYEDDKGQDYFYLYKTTHNGPFTPDGFEVEKVEFFSLDQIQSMLDSGAKFHPEFPFVWKKGLIKP